MVMAKAILIYVDSCGITAVGQRMGLLLHCAGMEVQEIFETLMDPGAPNGKNRTYTCTRLHFNHLMHA